MTNQTPSQNYGALRKLGHSMECAYEMAFNDAQCSCDPDRTHGKLIEVERKRGRPRQYASNAERQAAYRRRKFEDAANV
jgi:hypothetical protein